MNNNVIELDFSSGSANTSTDFSYFQNSLTLEEFFEFFPHHPHLIHPFKLSKDFFLSRNIIQHCWLRVRFWTSKKNIL